LGVWWGGGIFGVGVELGVMEFGVGALWEIWALLFGAPGADSVLQQFEKYMYPNSTAKVY
jgi:hypothetical protein